MPLPNKRFSLITTVRHSVLTVFGRDASAIPVFRKCPMRHFVSICPDQHAARQARAHQSTHFITIRSKSTVARTTCLPHVERRRLGDGYYDGSKLRMCNGEDYALADNFFMGTFGGSYLNHIWLICACTPSMTPRPRTHAPSGPQRQTDQRPTHYQLRTACACL